MLFAVIIGPSIEDAIQQMNVSHEADGFEIRLDCLIDLDFEKLKKLRYHSQKPILFTLRNKKEGGFFEGGDRFDKILKYCEFKPDFLDLEAFSDQPLFSKIPQEIKIISSYHNFQMTPCLTTLLKEMQLCPAYAYKIATMAHSTLDALKMMDFVKREIANGERLTGLSLGPFGMLTRILSPMISNFINFASVDDKAKVVPYQLSLQDLLKTYHYRKIHQNTSVYALIGDPIDYSLSHLSHNLSFEMNALNAVYVKLPLKENELSDFFHMAKELPILGLSVTMPLKEKVLAYMNHLTPHAKKCQSINTIAHQNGKWYGENFDGKGALDAIEKHTLVKGKKIALLGAGGSAKAIVYEAKLRGAEVWIFNRTFVKAKQLADEMEVSAFPLQELEKHQNYEILINTTSCGMNPHPEASPISADWILKGSIVMDIITSPKETTLLKEATKRDCKVIYGKEMFIHQALRQMELWFGKTIDKTICENVIKKVYA